MHCWQVVLVSCYSTINSFDVFKRSLFLSNVLFFMIVHVFPFLCCCTVRKFRQSKSNPGERRFGKRFQRKICCVVQFSSVEVSASASTRFNTTLLFPPSNYKTPWQAFFSHFKIVIRHKKEIILVGLGLTMECWKTTGLDSNSNNLRIRTLKIFLSNRIFCEFF